MESSHLPSFLLRNSPRIYEFSLFSRQNRFVQVQVPASTVSLAENQKIAHEKTKEQLYLQSRILQSHPFVTQAVLLGLPVPLGIGGMSCYVMKESTYTIA
jgi:hypothetical protein